MRAILEIHLTRQRRQIIAPIVEHTVVVQSRQNIDQTEPIFTAIAFFLNWYLLAIDDPHRMVRRLASAVQIVGTAIREFHSLGVCCPSVASAAAEKEIANQSASLTVGRGVRGITRNLQYGVFIQRAQAGDVVAVRPGQWWSKGKQYPVSVETIGTDSSNTPSVNSRT